MPVPTAEECTIRRTRELRGRGWTAVQQTDLYFQYLPWAQICLREHMAEASSGDPLTSLGRASTGRQKPLLCITLSSRTSQTPLIHPRLFSTRSRTRPMSGSVCTTRWGGKWQDWLMESNRPESRADRLMANDLPAEYTFTGLKFCQGRRLNLRSVRARCPYIVVF